MIASLPMYDTATTQGANDRFWTLIRNQLGYGPQELDRTSDLQSTWTDPKLLLSQTCGLPYRSRLHGRVALVGTPDYGVRGCPPGYYKSYIVVRKSDPRRHLEAFKGARLARNDIGSQSGWAAVEGHLKDHDMGFSFRNNVLDTGSHATSSLAVISGGADIASIDAVTWTLLKRETSISGHLRVLLSTRPTPGLPLISKLGNNTDNLFRAVTCAINTLTRRDKARLLVKDLIAIPADTYLAEPLPPM
ncbi:phosphate/phosphite/phosphonate ABC transporter substrate-binding protein [Roseobacter sp.]|uniref:phosphate/phosphite/phosphonate ABC transporter substrate-binding protein n=1 Tax=Roseobacter sp. TaxID=1907202 RepID=UPI00385FBF95